MPLDLQPPPIRLSAANDAVHGQVGKRHSLYLQNELNGWRAEKRALDSQIGVLTVALVLLVTLFYNGAVVPPGGWATTTKQKSDISEVISATYLTADGFTNAFFFCNSFGFALSTSGLLVIVFWTLIPSKEGQVVKAIDTFTGYIENMPQTLSLNDALPVSVTYQNAILNNLINSGGNPAWFLNQQKHTPVEAYVQDAYKMLPHQPTAAQAQAAQAQAEARILEDFRSHVKLFDQVLEFYRRNLPGEAQVGRNVCKLVTATFLGALLCAVAGYTLAYFAASIHRGYRNYDLYWQIFTVVMVGGAVVLFLFVCLVRKVDVAAAGNSDSATRPISLGSTAFPAA